MEMDDLCISIDIVLNECSRSIYNIKNEVLYKTVFKVSYGLFYSNNCLKADIEL